MNEINNKLFRNDPATYYTELGAELERERIIKLLEPEVTRHYELGLDASAAYLEQKIALIKDETRNITSEILPDGSIYIEEIKGKQK